MYPPGENHTSGAENLGYHTSEASSLKLVEVDGHPLTQKTR